MLETLSVLESFGSFIGFKVLASVSLQNGSFTTLNLNFARDVKRLDCIETLDTSIIR